MAGSLVAARSLPAEATDEESFWLRVRDAYAPSGRLLNLNNAAVSPQPKPVQEAMIAAYRFANELPDVHMWEDLDGQRDRTRAALAQLADCEAQEIALNRNATEGLCTVVQGIDLRPGDEVVISEWDYDSIRHAWEQRAQRHGLVLRRVDFAPLDSDDRIVDTYRAACSTRTKVMHFTHMLHYTGRVLPVQRLCAVARECGAQSVVDAAQSFAQVPLSFRAIGCDYLAVSLHKWLCAPFGTGMLIVKRDRIEPLWPLFAPYGKVEGIDKLDGWSLGTYSSPAEHAIQAALAFHHEIGAHRMHARLQMLSRYWSRAALDIPGMQLHTPVTHPDTSAVITFSLAGLEARKLESLLRSDYGIRVKARERAGFTGVRVSPHIYTTPADLDRFVAALRRIAQS